MAAGIRGLAAGAHRQCGARQLQLDVYGEVMDACYLARRGGMTPDDDAWRLQCALLDSSRDDLARAGRRHLGGPRRGAAFHPLQGDGVGRLRPRHQARRGVRARGPVDAGERSATQIHDDVCARRLRSERESFTQSYGVEELDASLLLHPTVGFLPARDPRVGGHSRRDRARPFAMASYALRHATDGRSAAGEGAFLACSFWLVDNYVLQGADEEASGPLRAAARLRNDVGLLAEEYDHVEAPGRQFPAGFLTSGADQYRAQPARRGWPSASGARRRQARLPGDLEGAFRHGQIRRQPSRIPRRQLLPDASTLAARPLQPRAHRTASLGDGRQLRHRPGRGPRPGRAGADVVVNYIDPEAVRGSV